MNKCAHALLVSLMLLFSYPQLQAQQFLIEEYGSRQGLASAEIYTLFQDATGYLWMGTRLGVSKFDGLEFTNYSGSEEERFGKVFSITQDNKGYIWIGGEHGLFFCKGDMVRHVPFGKTFPDPWVYAVYADEQSLWIGTANGPVHLDEKQLGTIRDGDTLQYQLFKNWSEFSSVDNQVFHIYRDHSGILYFGTRDKVIQYDGNGYGLVWQSREPSLEDVSGIYKSDGQNIYIGGRTGFFYKKNGEQLDTVHAFTFSGGMSWWGGNRYYVLGVDKVYEYDNEQPELVYDLSVKGYDYLSSILVDREKNIWIGTWEGLVKLRKNIFTTWLPGKTEYLNDIFSVTTLDNGMTIFGGNRGNVIVAVDTLSQQFFPQYPEAVVFQPYLPEHLKPWQSSEVFGMYFKNNTGWFGSGYEGISVYRFGQETTEMYHYDDTRLADMHGHGFFHDNNKNLFCLSEGGLTQILNEEDPANLSFRYYPWTVNIGGQYLKIFDHAVLQGNEIYLATNFGLVYFNGDTLLHVVTNDIALDNAIITSMTINRDGTLWLSTGNDGIYRVKTNRIEADVLDHVDKETGLLSNAVLDLLNTNKGLWCAHYNGLTMLNRDDKGWHVVKRMNEDEGFLPYDFTYIQLAGNDERIWLATTNGVQVFSPREIPFNKIDAAPVITNVLLFNGAIPISDYATGNTTGHLAFHPVLPHNKNSITFSFQSVSLSIPGQNACRYKLIGYDTAWTYADGFDEVTFAALGPGDYEFILQAANNDGIWSATTDHYTFTIRKPFWATWWFILSAILITAAVSYSVYRYRLNQLIRINAMRNKIAGDLHDDIGSTLSSISMYSEIISTQLRDKSPESTPLLKKMSENSKEMIGNMSDIVWAIKPSNDSLKNIGDRMFNFATELCNAKNIEFTMQQDEDISHVKIPMEQRRDLYLIYKEAVNNAVKYADCTTLEVRFTKHTGRLIMEVADNGIGFNTAIHKAGNGLENMRRRAKSHQWELEIKSEEGAGTQVRLTI